MQPESAEDATRRRLYKEVDRFFGAEPAADIEEGASGAITFRINHGLIGQLRCVMRNGLAQQRLGNPLLDRLAPAEVARRKADPRLLLPLLDCRTAGCLSAWLRRNRIPTLTQVA